MQLVGVYIYTYITKSSLNFRPVHLNVKWNNVDVSVAVKVFCYQIHKVHFDLMLAIIVVLVVVSY